MRRSYESQCYFQEGWSSLQTPSRSSTNTHRGLTLQTGMLGNLRARRTSKMCSNNFQIISDCGSWASSWNRNRLTEKLGINYPIIQGPFGGFPSQRLTAAVSNFR